MPEAGFVIVSSPIILAVLGQNAETSSSSESNLIDDSLRSSSLTLVYSAALGSAFLRVPLSSARYRQLIPNTVIRNSASLPPTVAATSSPFSLVGAVRAESFIGLASVFSGVTPSAPVQFEVLASAMPASFNSRPSVPTILTL